jgi:hypothetical protein
MEFRERSYSKIKSLRRQEIPYTKNAKRIVMAKRHLLEAANVVGGEPGIARN